MNIMQGSQSEISRVLSLLVRLKESGIRIQVVNGQLKLNAPKGKLNPALINELKEQKNEIIEFLQRSDEKHVKFSSINPSEDNDYYPLTSAQKRLYILQQMVPNSTAYNIPQFFELPGEQDTGKLAGTFLKLIGRHESLRTSFHVIEGTPRQKIHPLKGIEFTIDHHTAKSSGQGEQGIEINQIIEAFIRPFNLSQAPSIRVALTKIEPLRHVLMVDMHHIISDGVSHSILIRDFSSLYSGKQLPALRLQYKDYSQWQQSEANQHTLKHQEGYWLEEFQGEIPVLPLPTDCPRPAYQSFEGSVIDFELSREQSRVLYEMTRSEGITLFMLLLAVYYIFLSKLSGQEDIVVGTPAAGRRHADLEPIIGMFVNTLPLRNYPLGQETFTGFLSQIKQRTVKAFDNQDYQFEDLVEKAVLQRDLSRNPLFDVTFELDNITEQGKNVKEETKMEERPTAKPYSFESRTAKFDLLLYAAAGEVQLTFIFEYCTKLFKTSTIERFIHYFKSIISTVLANPGLKLSEIEIITEEEKHQLLYNFNDTKRDYPRNRTIHQLFEEQAERTPDHLVLVGKFQITNYKPQTHLDVGDPGWEPLSITYQELNEKSNQLANLLRAKGVQTDTIVGLMVERCIEMVVGILAILKAGGAYLPIDPGYPGERIKYILTDSRAKILLSEVIEASKVGKLDEGIELILVDKAIEDFITSPTQLTPLTTQHTHLTHPTQLCYIIYTSGTTGKPKGTLVAHQSLINLCFWHNRCFQVTESDHAAQYAGLGFDASVWEVFPYLIVGSTLHILSDEIRLEVEKLNNYFERNHISITFLPTQVCERFMALDNRSLRVLLTGGDKLNRYIPRRYRLVNNYGPTESTVVTTSFLVDRDFGNIPIGEPIANIRVYILDNNQQLQPVGIPGELCIGGDGLARGYLNRPELTAEKFLATEDPESNHRVYCTGDLARWLWDGNIEFLGRIDHQVKIRGYRIELGEIENRLLGHPMIKEAGVIVREVAGDKHLCAYMAAVCEAQGAGRLEINVGELREYLSARLPGYMIPSFFVFLELLPLNPNGKIDRKALPEPEIKIEKEYMAPQDQVEEKLAEIWAEELGVEKNKIGIDANFFQLGGHSLKATRIVAAVDKKLNVRLPLIMLFENPTIRGLSGYIKKEIINKPAAVEQIEPVEKKDYYDLSYAQRRLWILDRIEEELIAYNIPASYEFKELNREAFDRTIETTVKRHESLRTTFIVLNGEPKQKIHDYESLDFKVNYLDLRKEDNKEKIVERLKKEEEKTPFNLATGPLVRTKLVHLEENQVIFLLTLHHIISDIWSMEVMVNEFLTLYDSYCKGKENSLSPLRIQYKDYTQWHNNQLSEENLEIHRNYWLNKFKGEIPILKLPADYPRPKLRSFKGEFILFSLSKKVTEQMKRISREFECTLFITFLAVMNAFLSRYTGQTDIIVGTPLAGRERKDLENQIGFYVNMLALRNQLTGGQTFREVLPMVKSNTLEAFEHQLYPFDQLANELNRVRDLSHNPLFDIVVTAQTVDDLPENVDMSQFTGEYNTDDLINNGFGTSKHDLRLRLFDFGSQSLIHIQYNPDLFKKERIMVIKERLISLITDITANIDKKIDSLNFWADFEKKQINKKFQEGF